MDIRYRKYDVDFEQKIRGKKAGKWEERGAEERGGREEERRESSVLGYLFISAHISERKERLQAQGLQAHAHHTDAIHTTK